MNFIYLVKIPKPFYDFDKLLNNLDPNEQKQITKYKFSSDRESHLISCYIKKFLTNNQKIYYNLHGKPMSDNIEFNVSHDKDIIVGVKDKFSIGIDVMSLNRKIEVSNFKNLFSQSEWQWINGDKKNFLILWCIKEAYFKMIGTGLTTNMQSIDVIFENRWLIYFQGKLDSMVFINLFYYQEYLIVCASKQNEEWLIKELNLTSFNGFL